MITSDWTEEEKTTAQRIVNDIFAETDNGESRESLRKALAIWNDLAEDRFREGFRQGVKSAAPFGNLTFNLKTDSPAERNGG